MVQVIAEVIEAATESLSVLEECRISVGVIEDMRAIISEIAEVTTGTDTASELEDVDVANLEMNNTTMQLDPHETYFKDGHAYETDDNGSIYKKDGEVIPGIEYTDNGWKYKVDQSGNAELIEEGYQTSYKERMDHTPAEGDRGTWEGKRGESKYIPTSETENGAKATEKLDEYGMDGVEYKDAIPDLSKCSDESVEIDMTERRYGPNGNFTKADMSCADKWNDEKKDGRANWTAQEIADYRSANRMTWHECTDRKTCQMVSLDIHEYFGHTGGVMECKKSIVEEIGGVFDA